MVQVDSSLNAIPDDKDINNPHNNIKLVMRFRFKKVGRLQYISHLDLVRTMNKILVRSKLPLYYTEGFNPKPKMVFAAPLSIGTESYSEFMDVRLTKRISPDEAMKALNANMTDEMQVIEAYYPETKFTDMKWLSYTILINTLNSSEKLAGECADYLNSDKVEVLKHTKSGEATVDIRPLIKSVSATYNEGVIKLSATISADPSAFLNPEYLIKALRERLGVLSADDITKEEYSIVREKAYCADMSEFR